MASVAAPFAPAEVVRHDQSLGAVGSGRGLALRIALSCLLLSTTVLQSLGVNFGTYSLNTALLGMYGCLLVAGLSNALALSHRRLVLYVTCVTVALMSLLVNASFAR